MRYGVVSGVNDVDKGRKRLQELVVMSDYARRAGKRATGKRP